MWVCSSLFIWVLDKHGFPFFSSSLSTFVTPHILDKNPLTPTNIWVLSSVEKGMNHRWFPGQMTLQASRFIIDPILFGNDSSPFWCNAVTWAEALEVSVKRFPDFNYHTLIIQLRIIYSFYMFIYPIFCIWYALLLTLICTKFLSFYILNIFLYFIFFAFWIPYFKLY